MLMPSKLPMPSNNFYFRHQYLSGSDVIWWLTHDSDTLVILWWHVPALVCMNSDNQWRVTLMMQPVWPQIIQLYWAVIGQISVTWLNTELWLVNWILVKSDVIDHDDCTCQSYHHVSDLHHCTGSTWSDWQEMFPGGRLVHHQLLCSWGPDSRLSDWSHQSYWSGGSGYRSQTSTWSGNNIICLSSQLNLLGQEI